jgi:methionyl-tRNA formyltransferase
MRIAFFGSGEFGCPTLARLADGHDVRVVITQPDKPAGRSRALRATPIADLAAKIALLTVKPADVNDPELTRTLAKVEVEAFVVIAYGHKLSRSLLDNHFAINLHASLLPKYRGAAPIQWAMMNGETKTGVSVIELAQRMDAGRILAQESTPIDPEETAGELHDRLSALGPPVVADVLSSFERGTLEPMEQEERMATKAPRLSRADGWVSFAQSARMVRARIHGLTPWPGCWAQIDGEPIRLARAREHVDALHDSKPGTVLPSLLVACAPGLGAVELLEVQPPGGKLMTFEAYRNGRPVKPGAMVTSAAPVTGALEERS